MGDTIIDKPIVNQALLDLLPVETETKVVERPHNSCQVFLFTLSNKPRKPQKGVV